MIWRVPSAIRTWNRLSYCRVSIFSMNSVLDSGLLRTWTIFARSASTNSTLIKSRISTNRRKNKLLLIEWEFLFSNNIKAKRMKYHRVINKVISKKYSLNKRSKKGKKLQFSTVISIKKNRDNTKDSTTKKSNLSNKILYLSKSNKDK